MRAINLWTLGELSVPLFKVLMESRPNALTVADGMLRVILSKLLDHNGTVREAATSALGGFCEAEAEACMAAKAPRSVYFTADRCAEIVRVLGEASTRYPVRNLTGLTSSLTKFTATAGPNLMQMPEVVKQLVDPLVTRLTQTHPLNYVINNLLDDLSSIVKDIKYRFDYAAPQVFAKCLQIAQMQLQARDGQFAPDVAPFDYDESFLVCAFDCIANMCEGLGASLEPLVASNAGTLFPLILLACRPLSEDYIQDGESPETQRTAFGLMGDLVRTCRQTAAAYISRIIELVLQRLNPATYNSFTAVCTQF